MFFEVSFYIPSLVLAIFFFAGGSDLLKQIVRVVVGPFVFPGFAMCKFPENVVKDIEHAFSEGSN